MKFYLTVSQVGGSGINQRDVIDIFRFVLKEREAEFPKAHMSVYLNEAPRVGDHVTLYMGKDTDDPVVLFAGYCHGLTSKPGACLADIECIAYDESVLAALDGYRDQLVELGRYDKLLVKEQSDGRPSLKDLLMFSAYIPFISRDLQDVSLLTLSGADTTGNCEEVRDVTDHCWSDTLQIYSHAGKGAALRPIEITASWVESYAGTSDISQALQARLPEQCIETFTGKALEKRWWPTDATYGLHGYRVFESDLHFMGRGRTLVSGNDDRHKETTTTSVRYKPKLSLSWRYRQPRKEIVTISNIKTTPTAQTPKPLKLNVRGLRHLKPKRIWRGDTYYKKGDYAVFEDQVFIANDAHRSSNVFTKDETMWKFVSEIKDFDSGYTESSFFQSDRGLACLVSLAHVHDTMKQQSNRNEFVNFTCSGLFGLRISVKSCLHLTDRRLPNGGFRGKVRTLDIEADGKTGRFISRISLCSLVNMQPEPRVESRPGVPISYVDGYQPEEPKLFSGEELVQEISLTNDANDQQNYLSQADNPAGAYSLPGTCLYVRLKDLSESDTKITHYEGVVS